MAEKMTRFRTNIWRRWDLIDVSASKENKRRLFPVHRTTGRTSNLLLRNINMIY